MDLTSLREPGARLDGSSELPHDAPFTAAVARAVGVHRNHLGLLCRWGVLKQPVHGVYVAAQVEDSILLRAQCLGRWIEACPPPPGPAPRQR